MNSLTALNVSPGTQAFSYLFCAPQSSLQPPQVPEKHRASLDVGGLYTQPFLLPAALLQRQTLHVTRVCSRSTGSGTGESCFNALDPLQCQE